MSYRKSHRNSKFKKRRARKTKRVAKNRSFTKKVRRIATRAIMRKAETKILQNSPVKVTYTTPSTPHTCATEMSTLMPQLQQGTANNQITGTKAENCRYHWKFRFTIDHTSPYSSWTEVRMIWFMPKANQSNIQAQAYMSTLFLSLSLIHESIYFSVDDRYVNVLKDTGVIHLAAYDSRTTYSTVFTWAKKDLNMIVNSAVEQPQDRFPTLYMIYCASDASLIFERMMVNSVAFKDV